MLVDAGIALAKELFGKVASGEITADQASSEYEMEALKGDTKIALGQQEIVKIDAQSDRMIQWAWRPLMCIAVCLVTMIWPFASITDTFGWVELTEAQMENLKASSTLFLPRAVAAMGLREVGKFRRQQGWISKIGNLIGKGSG